MDLTLPHQSVPTLGTGCTSNEESASRAIGHMFTSVLPTQFGINEHRVEVAQCPRTERQKSSLGDAGLECCGAFFTTADILSLTAFVVSTLPRHT
jgi:hypothetical protein